MFLSSVLPSEWHTMWMCACFVFLSCFLQFPVFRLPLECYLNSYSFMSMSFLDCLSSFSYFLPPCYVDSWISLSTGVQSFNYSFLRCAFLSIAFYRCLVICPFSLFAAGLSLQSNNPQTTSLHWICLSLVTRVKFCVLHESEWKSMSTELQTVEWNGKYI